MTMGFLIYLNNKIVDSFGYNSVSLYDVISKFLAYLLISIFAIRAVYTAYRFHIGDLTRLGDCWIDAIDVAIMIACALIVAFVSILVGLSLTIDLGEWVARKLRTVRLERKVATLEDE